MKSTSRHLDSNSCVLPSIPQWLSIKAKLQTTATIYVLCPGRRYGLSGRTAGKGEFYGKKQVRSDDCQESECLVTTLSSAPGLSPCMRYPWRQSLPILAPPRLKPISCLLIWSVPVPSRLEAPEIPAHSGRSGLH